MDNSSRKRSLESSLGQHEKRCKFDKEGEIDVKEGLNETHKDKNQTAEDQNEVFEEELVDDNENATSEEESECGENYNDYDYYNDFDDLVSDVPIAEMHPLLSQDIERVIEKYGEKAITHKNFEAIGEIDVDLHVPCNHFDNEVAKAWRIDNKEDIIVRLHMDLTKYVDVQPKVEVFQLSQPERFGVLSQMKNVLDLFLRKQNEAATNATQTPNSHITAASKQNEVTTDVAKTPDSHITTVSKPTVVPKVSQQQKSAIPVSYADQVMLEHKRKGKKKGKAKKMMKLEPPAADVGTKKQVIAIEPEPHTVASKFQPSRDAGFLAMIYEYCRQRLDTLNEFCVVCDEPHLFQNTMLKPAVCSRQLCLFAFKTLGVMSEATDDINTIPEVVDLLITMAKAACKSKRRSMIFNPFPAVVDPMNSQHLALNPAKKNFKRCAQALSALDMHTLCLYEGADLKKFVDKQDTLAFPLLQWLMASNRSHIVNLPVTRRLHFMNTPHQFLLKSSPPVKEALFQEYKRKYGSTFAFHGSRTENWHAIIRNGLMNASGTKYQLNGAAIYGNGIYLSPSGETSLMYCFSEYGKNTLARQAHETGSPFLKTDRDVICLALCEVITSRELTKHPGEEWVMPDPDKVCTRFLFVYDCTSMYDNRMFESDVYTQKEPYKSAIRKAAKSN